MPNTIEHALADIELDRDTRELVTVALCARDERIADLLRETAAGLGLMPSTTQLALIRSGLVSEPDGPTLELLGGQAQVEREQLADQGALIATLADFYNQHHPSGQ